MDTADRWQAFARTGDILAYLAYRRGAQQAQRPAPEDYCGETHGCDRDAGAGPAGN